MKKLKFLLLLLLRLCLIAPGISIAQDSKKVTISDFPVADLPNNADRAKLKQESYKYYYGIGTEIDYVKARQQAFIEVEKDTSESPVGGFSVLMMLYANGYGVERHLDLSIRIACANIWSAPAELEGRIQHLTDMKKGRGAVTKEGVRKAQRSWILYRDAWAWFGVIKCPGSTEFWWKTMITQERITQLQELVDNQY